MRRLLVVSFDAVGDSVWPRLAALPNFAALAAKSAVARGAGSVFLTNTYPVHTSIVTGLPQGAHGLLSNTEPFPRRHPRWCTDARLIKAETLWQAAATQGLRTAAVMWPVTGHARDIRWNIPELMIQPGQNQVVENLKAGSKWLQLRLVLRHRHLLNGIEQPARDRFATACMADILREKRPALALMHLTAFDSLCHRHGPDSPVLDEALAAMDENLGALLAAAGADTDVIVFSDHSQLAVAQAMLPNDLLVEMVLMRRGDDGDYHQPPEGCCFFECCGGSAFFHPWRLGEAQIAEVQARAAALPGFGRLLWADELAACGRADLPFGFAAAPGWACEAYDSGEKANHGYPVDTPDYAVFYLACGAPFAAGRTVQGGTLLDVAPLAALALGLELPGIGAARGDMLA